MGTCSPFPIPVMQNSNQPLKDVKKNIILRRSRPISNILMSCFHWVRFFFPCFHPEMTSLIKGGFSRKQFVLTFSDAHLTNTLDVFVFLGKLLQIHVLCILNLALFISMYASLQLSSSSASVGTVGFFICFFVHYSQQLPSSQTAFRNPKPKTACCHFHTWKPLVWNVLPWHCGSCG